MSQPLFNFVLSTENNEIMLFSRSYRYFHNLKGIMNDDSFKKYMQPGGFY